jgi:hypothetical protein
LYQSIIDHPSDYLNPNQLTGTPCESLFQRFKIETAGTQMKNPRSQERTVIPEIKGTFRIPEMKETFKFPLGQVESLAQWVDATRIRVPDIQTLRAQNQEFLRATETLSSQLPPSTRLSELLTVRRLETMSFDNELPMSFRASEILQPQNNFGMQQPLDQNFKREYPAAFDPQQFAIQPPEQRLNNFGGPNLGAFPDWKQDLQNNFRHQFFMH